MKKLETRKVDLDKVTKLKAKFEVAKAKKIDLEKRASAAQAEVTRLRSLVEKEEAKLPKLEDRMKVANMVIFSVGNQALEKAKVLASTKVEAGKWSTLVAKAQRDKETTKRKWTALKN